MPEMQLLGMTPAELREVAAEAGLRPFAADQIARRIYKLRATSIDEMTELPLAARQSLAKKYTVGRSAPKAEARSKDGTVKYLFEGAGGMDVEAVYIPDRDRATLCVSSQAGCRMGCKFCMTGRQGLHGSLSASAILNQILSIPESETLTNIVFMGMGEPMDNLTAVIRAPRGAHLQVGHGHVAAPHHRVDRRSQPRRSGTPDQRHPGTYCPLAPLPYAAQRGELMPAERAWSGPRLLNSSPRPTISAASAAYRSNTSCGMESTPT